MPAKSSAQYNETVRSFYIGLAALQVGDDVRADAKLAETTKLVPAEPAAWANWGLLALRQRNFDLAAERLERARSLAPDDDQINYLIGLLESSRGRSAESLLALRKAVAANPKNLIAGFKLAEEIERQGGDNSEAEYQQLIQKLLEVQPDNLALLLDLGRISAKRSDAVTLHQVVAKLGIHAASWPTEVQQQFSAVQTAAAGTDFSQTATKITFLRNVLVRVLQYRLDLGMVKPPPGEEAVPFTHFLLLESPSFGPAPADTGFTFAAERLPEPSFENAKWNWAGAIYLGSAGTPAVATANAQEVQLSTGATVPFPGGASATPPSPDSILSIDFSYDFKTDLVLAGAGGVRLLRQDNPAAFTDVTAKTKLPAAVTNGDYVGAWTADIEADGDLDIVLGAGKGEPTVLRNNGDETFIDIHPFKGISGLQGFAWADLDADGDPDAALIDGASQLHVFSNERQGQFRERNLPSGQTTVRSINVADINSDSVMDLLAVQSEGAITRLSDKNEGQDWETAEIANLGKLKNYLLGSVRLLVADFDNNGGNDLLLTSNSPRAKDEAPGGLVFVSDEQNNLKLLGNQFGSALVFDAADLNGDGRVDLLGLTAGGEPVRSINHGTKNYHWQVVRPHASQASGDQRINPFGVGGEMELRAGLMLQKQPITGPSLHFGLGDQTGADVIRIVWPNGSVRAEFETKGDQTILAEQRLKGSCPFLFAYDGREMKFVKDAAPWGSAIGLRINTLGTARVAATEEWYKIGGAELAPRDGYYDLRITAELWETYYYDHLALMTIDHPGGTDVFTDERFVIPPAKLAITTLESPHKIARAWDDDGKDVTEIVSTLDEKYLDNFGRGRYQGVTRDHFVEVDLGEDAPASGALWLVAKGWMHPTDSSINVAISEGHNVQPKPLSLEVPDGKRNWVTVNPNLGFPAGRKKICLVDLSNVFRPGTPRRLRLRTNLEVFWDSLEWAKGLPETQVKTIRINPELADLHYRGYSVIDKPNVSSPEVPNYNQMASSKQVWRDLIGYYTRFGDVRELLDKVDDRYVIMNAGDEMSLRFPEQAAPPAGWVRDYIFVGDGWIKDGDYNSTFSKTVLPLPYHAKQEYNDAPTSLEDEWVFKQHPEDWQKYHTRYVTPDVFKNALRVGRAR